MTEKERTSAEEARPAVASPSEREWALFCVETQKPNGEWQQFTEEPFVGRAAAEKHCVTLKEAAAGYGHNSFAARARPLTVVELIQRLSPKDRETIVAQYVNDRNCGTFCRGCGAPLWPENAWMTDGCPCNTPLGVNAERSPDARCERENAFLDAAGIVEAWKKDVEPAEIRIIDGIVGQLYWAATEARRARPRHVFRGVFTCEVCHAPRSDEAHDAARTTSPWKLLNACRYDDPPGMRHDKGTPVVVGYEAIYKLVARLVRERDAARAEGEAKGRAEEREACALEAERSLIEYAEIDILDTTPERLRIARRIRARAARPEQPRREDGGNGG